MLNDLSLEEIRGLWEWFIALSIAAILMMMFLVVYAAVSQPQPEPKRGCSIVSQLEVVEIPCRRM